VLETPGGVDTTPGGLSEGLPDYLSAALTEDPVIGEYVGQAIDPDSLAVRDLGRARSCPEHLAGESHADGLIIGSALWQVRSELPADDRPAMDGAVVAAIAGLTAGVSFGAFQSLVVVELDLALGSAAADQAAAVFAERGLDGCGDFIRDLAPDETHEQLFLRHQRGGESNPPYLAPFQIRLVLAGPAD